MATDEELINLIKSGSRADFEILYKRYFAKLYCVIYKRVRSKEIAEEIIQDMFADLWINKERIEIKGLFSSYVFTAVKYKVFKYFKNEDQRINYKQRMISAIPVNATEETLSYKELAEKFEVAMNLLPERTKKVYILSRKENKSNKQIALLLGITEKAVEYHITKSISLLKIDLKDFISLTTFLLVCLSR